MARNHRRLAEKSRRGLCRGRKTGDASLRRNPRRKVRAVPPRPDMRPNAARSRSHPPMERSGRQNARTDILPRRPYNDGASLRSAIRDAGRVLVRVLAARSRPVAFRAGAGGRHAHRSSRLFWRRFPYLACEKTRISACLLWKLGGRLFRYAICAIAGAGVRNATASAPRPQAASAP